MYRVRSGRFFIGKRRGSGGGGGGEVCRGGRGVASGGRRFGVSSFKGQGIEKMWSVQGRAGGTRRRRERGGGGVFGKLFLASFFRARKKKEIRDGNEKKERGGL